MVRRNILPSVIYNANLTCTIFYFLITLSAQFFLQNTRPCSVRLASMSNSYILGILLYTSFPKYPPRVKKRTIISISTHRSSRPLREYRRVTFVSVTPSLGDFLARVTRMHPPVPDTSRGRPCNFCNAKKFTPPHTRARAFERTPGKKSISRLLRGARTQGLASSSREFGRPWNVALQRQLKAGGGARDYMYVRRNARKTWSREDSICHGRCRRWLSIAFVLPSRKIIIALLCAACGDVRGLAFVAKMRFYASFEFCARVRSCGFL